MKLQACLAILIFIAGCNYRPVTIAVWAEAVSDDKFKIEKTYDNIDVINRFKKSDRVILDRDDYVIVKYSSADYIKTYGKAIAITPITLTIDGIIILLGMGAVR